MAIKCGDIHVGSSVFRVPCWMFLLRPVGLRRFSDSSSPISTLRRFATKKCETCGLAVFPHLCSLKGSHILYPVSSSRHAASRNQHPASLCMIHEASLHHLTRLLSSHPVEDGLTGRTAVCSAESQACGSLCGCLFSDDRAFFSLMGCHGWENERGRFVRG